MSTVIDEHREEYGVEPICRTLGIAPSTYYAVKTRRREPSERALSDERVLGEIRRVYGASRGRYGARKVYWQLQREEIGAAKCTVERLMAKHGLRGAVRAASIAPRLLMLRLSGRRTSSIATSKRWRRIVCG
jgi:putative transposase